MGARSNFSPIRPRIAPVGAAVGVGDVDSRLRIKVRPAIPCTGFFPQCMAEGESIRAGLPDLLLKLCGGAVEVGHGRRLAAVESDRCGFRFVNLPVTVYVP